MLASSQEREPGSRGPTLSSSPGEKLVMWDDAILLAKYECTTLVSRSLPSGMLHHQLHQVFLLCQVLFAYNDLKVGYETFGIATRSKETCSRQPRCSADKKFLKWSRVHLAWAEAVVPVVTQLKCRGAKRRRMVR